MGGVSHVWVEFHMCGGSFTCVGTLPESLVCTTQFFTELTVSVRLNKLNSTYIY